MASGDTGPGQAPIATADSLPALTDSGGGFPRARRVAVAFLLSLVLIVVMIAALVLVLQNTFRVAA